MKTIKVTAYYLLILFFSAEALADFNFQLPMGTYHYSGEAIVETLRIAETLDHTSESGLQKKKELQRQNFICVRKNQIQTICQKSISDAELPEEFKAPIAQKLERLNFYFEATQQEPRSVSDTSDEHRWAVTAPIQLGNKKLTGYQFVYLYKSDRQYLSFPIQDDQPFGYLFWDQNQLLLPLTVQTKKAGQTWGYVIKAKMSLLLTQF